MAINLDDRYPGRANGKTLSYPQGSFKNRTSPTAKDGTYLEQDWANDQLAFFQSLIKDAGMTVSGSVDTVETSQYFDALRDVIRRGLYNSAVAGGTADAITASYSPAIVTLTNGMTLRVRAASANTTSAPTFQADSTAAKTIVKGSNEALLPGDIKGAGHWLELQYDSVLDKWVLQNPARGIGVIPLSGKLSTSGFRVAADGLIIQSGLASINPGQAAADVTFPVAFPNQCMGISITDNAVDSSSLQYQGFQLITKTGFRVWSSNTNGDQPCWIAIGY